MGVAIVLVAIALGSCSAVSGRLSEQEGNYQQLKQTWDMANQHFIVAQDQLHQQMYFMEQKQQLLKQKDLSPSLNTDL